MLRQQQPRGLGRLSCRRQGHLSRLALAPWGGDAKGAPLSRRGCGSAVATSRVSFCFFGAFLGGSFRREVRNFISERGCRCSTNVKGDTGWVAEVSNKNTESARERAARSLLSMVPSPLVVGSAWHAGLPRGSCAWRARAAQGERFEKPFRLSALSWAHRTTPYHGKPPYEPSSAQAAKGYFSGPQASLMLAAFRSLPP
jgi:hypothetical protein